MSTKIRPQKY